MAYGYKKYVVTDFEDTSLGCIFNIIMINSFASYGIHDRLKLYPIF